MITGSACVILMALFAIFFQQIILLLQQAHALIVHQMSISHSRIYNSDTILDLEHEPHHVIIYGAGVSCEYASIFFRGLRVKVDFN